VQVCLICQVASNPWKHLGGHSNTLCGQMTQCIFEELIVHIHLTCRILESTSRSRPFINQHHRPQILDSINGTATTIQSSNQYRTTATQFSSALVHRRSVQQDILTSLLAETLLKIISQPPSKNYLDLAQSCQFLHNFVKLSAGRICNEAIRRHFLIEAAPLKSGLEAE
jgi:hypothetical protein